MPLGVLFALGAYALYSCCDAIIKGFGNGLTVYEIACFSALFSMLPAIFTKPKGEHWRHVFRLRHPWLVHIRSVAGVIGNLCVIFAFVHIPLADTYSLAFLAPIFFASASNTSMNNLPMVLRFCSGSVTPWSAVRKVLDAST